MSDLIIYEISPFIINVIISVIILKLYLKNEETKQYATH